MSTHGRSGIGRWLYGSVADQILKEVHVPVVLVSTACYHRWEDDRPFRFLVPLDGSLRSETALGPARELAEAFRPELLLVRAIYEATPESNGLTVEGYPIRIQEGGARPEGSTAVSRGDSRQAGNGLCVDRRTS